MSASRTVAIGEAALVKLDFDMGGGRHPEAAFAHKIIGSKELANSLVRLGDYVAENGLTGDGVRQEARKE